MDKNNSEMFLIFLIFIQNFNFVSLVSILFLIKASAKNLV